MNQKLFHLTWVIRKLLWKFIDFLIQQFPVGEQNRSTWKIFNRFIARLECIPHTFSQNNRDFKRLKHALESCMPSEKLFQRKFSLFRAKIRLIFSRNFVLTLKRNTCLRTPDLQREVEPTNHTPATLGY